MNLDDETLLSAYLDDELDPADRLAVEWSIESNPPLAEQFRSLAQARDAVSGLPRPAIPRDLGPVLGARLAANRRRERLRKLARPAGVAFAFSGFFGIAASLIFALILLNHSLHESDKLAQIADQPVPPIRSHLPVPIIKPAETPQLASTLVPVVPRPVDPKNSSPRPGSFDETRELDARRAIAGMLEQPHVRRIRIVTDVLDASDKVKDLIHQDARKNPEFGRISICQEIVIDPECAEAAEVFAVPMDERDRKAFVGQLARSFPSLVEESDETSPDLVTQLTEVGQVALFSGTKAAPLVDPPHDLRPFIANRAEFPQNHIVESNPQSLEPGRPKDPTDERKAESPKLVARPSTKLKPSERVTVLVWVVTRPTRRL
jgi:anti-sigma factor RsiW